MNKKAEVGIGTLIIFIAMILVAAIAAGVLLQTASSLQNKALVTGERSKSQVSTGLITLNLYAEDGTDQDVESFCQKMKLQPGSESIKFDDLLIEVQTKNISESLIHGVELSNVSASPQTMTIDLDGDGTNDAVYLQRGAGVGNDNLSFNLSTTSEIINVSLSADTSASRTTAVEISVFNVDINTTASNQVGAATIIGTNNENHILDDDLYIFVGATDGGANGAYGVTYLVQGSLYRDGYLNRGDVVEICYGGPRQLVEDEDLLVTIVPKTGSVHSIETVIPDVVTQKRVYIFP